MRVLLVSTYDLGRQPFGLASPAAWLRREGIDVACVDAARTRVSDDDLVASDVIGFYLPMHTATRLAMPLVARARRVNPAAHIVAYGLYAPLNEAWLRERGVHEVLGPEAEADLVRVANSQHPTPNSQPPASNAQRPVPDAQLPTPNAQLPTPHTELPTSNNHEPTLVSPVEVGSWRLEVGSLSVPRLELIQPERAGLPPLERYASLQMPDGSRRVVGFTDATRGCKHLCRHCPIVPVYRGQFRVVPAEVVMRDIAAQLAAGARHISFGDPDFFNGPTHARRIVEGLAARHPGVTYDVTIKVEHLLRHADLLPLLHDTGCLFVTSAVESLDDEVLLKLAKGHTRRDFERVVDLCRAADLTLSPTFVPFTPWTTIDGYLELVDTLDRLDLVEETAPIQLAIRLLVTAGSPLLALEEIAARVQPFDAASLTWPWRHDDPRVDRLQDEIMRLVGRWASGPRRATFEAVRELAREAAGAERRGTAPIDSVGPLDGAVPVTPAPGARASSRPARDRATVPYLNEPWYC